MELHVTPLKVLPKNRELSGFSPSCVCSIQNEPKLSLRHQKPQWALHRHEEVQDQRGSLVVKGSDC